MSSIMQGTTPALTIHISESDFSLADVMAMELYIEHKRSTTTYKMEDVTIDTAANTITKRFTEEETAALNPHYDLTVQGRFWFANGSIVGIKKISLDVSDMLGVGV